MLNQWQSVTVLPRLEAGEVQLWRIHLNETVDSPLRYKQHLSPVELERADRLRAGPVRMQFIVGRACLRVLLGKILGLPPTSVPIALNAYGKPEISPFDDLQIFFNVAHSRETILIAVCRSGSVGVDVEYLDRVTAVLEIARNSFSQREILQIEEIADPAGRQHAFFRCWTRKEAVVKADGRGLSIPLTAVEVPVLDAAMEAPVRVPESSAPEAATRTWFVTDIALGEEVAGAFAVSLPRLALHRFNFPLELLFND